MIWVALFILAAFYFYIYAKHPAVPGASLEYPLGWWGWFDQGEYLKSANALRSFDFSPENHFYPPVYPALGAIELAVKEAHPFLLVNLICTLIFVLAFCQFAKTFVNTSTAILLFFISILANPVAFEQLVIPWTTTLSAALMSTVFLSLTWVYRLQFSGLSQIEIWKLTLSGFCAGLMFATRPLDGVFAGIAGIVSLSVWLYAFSGSSGHRYNRYRAIGLLSLFIALSIGPLIFFSFNYATTGSVMGSYFSVASSNGFYFEDIPEKMFSLFVNGERLYGEINSGFLQRQSWIIIFLMTQPYLFQKKSWILAVINSIVLLFLGLYSSYGDLLPTGLWRYLNFHYFIWAFPYMALSIWVATSLCWQRVLLRDVRFLSARSFWAILILLIIVLIDMTPAPVSVRQEVVESSFQLENRDHEHLTDYIDFIGMTAPSFETVYFPSDHSLFVDKKKLRSVSDYRMVPIASGTRVVFLRPIRWTTIDFVPPKEFVVDGTGIAVRANEMSFSFGSALLDKEAAISRVSPTDIGYDKKVPMAAGAISRALLGAGWHGPETWGRWSSEKKAALIFLTPEDVPPSGITVRIWGGPLVAGSGRGCSPIEFYVNDGLVRTEYCDGSVRKYRDIQIAPSLLGVPGTSNYLVISLPRLFSGRALGINSDGRRLGFAIQNIQFSVGEDRFL